MTLHVRGLKILSLLAVLGIGSIGAYVGAQPNEQVIKIVAKKFDYTPNVIKLKKGVPVVLEFTTLDIVMGFKVPDLGIRTDIVPGKVSQVRLVPDKVGTFPFVCDIFCGSGHEDMTGTIIVSE
jgi:cytochrome c oxidase subunit 2